LQGKILWELDTKYTPTEEELLARKTGYYNCCSKQPNRVSKQELVSKAYAYSQRLVAAKIFPDSILVVTADGMATHWNLKTRDTVTAKGFFYDKDMAHKTITGALWHPHKDRNKGFLILSFLSMHSKGNGQDVREKVWHHIFDFPSLRQDKNKTLLYDGYVVQNESMLFHICPGCISGYKFDKEETLMPEWVYNNAFNHNKTFLTCQGVSDNLLLVTYATEKISNCTIESRDKQSRDKQSKATVLKTVTVTYFEEQLVAIDLKYGGELLRLSFSYNDYSSIQYLLQNNFIFVIADNKIISYLYKGGSWLNLPERELREREIVKDYLVEGDRLVLLHAKKNTQEGTGARVTALTISGLPDSPEESRDK
jgi:hypothetical protein